jgi:hypothetical protein
MTNGNGPELAERVAQRGREVVAQRLRSAFAHQAAARGGGVDLESERMERMVQEAASRAGEALWRRSLAEAAMEELGIDLPEALAHPVLADAQELIDAQADVPLPPAEATPEISQATELQPHLDLGPDTERHEPRKPYRSEPYAEPVPMIADPHALRLSAVHLSGIETLYQGDDDLELRLSEAGLDVLKRSNGAAIGRLEWSEIETVALPAPKRGGLRSRRRTRELHVSTGRGQAQFELPGLTDEELHEHLEPTLARLRGASPNTRNAAPSPEPAEATDDEGEGEGGVDVDAAGSPASAS